MKRVAVTGIGIVSPLGRTADISWKNLVAGKSGITTISHVDVEDMAAHIAGVVPAMTDSPESGFDFENYLPAKDRRRMDRFILFAIAAADEAIAQANFAEQDESLTDAGAMIASGIGGIPMLSQAVLDVNEHPPKKLSPFTVPGFLANLAAGQVSIRNGLKGPSGCPVTACAAGAQAIGDAARIIRAGEAPVMIAGGTEACISRVTIGAFGAMKALSTRNDDPKAASRPFDAGRDGFVMAEGAAILVLEDMDHAKARGATILAELVGYGTSSDAHHISAPPENGEGAIRAVKAAMKQANVQPDDIDYINAHATSTPVGDIAEVSGLRTVFGDALNTTPISSTKSATGHLLGAAGAIEAAFSVLALQHQTIPPTLNLENIDEKLTGLDFVPGKARQTELNTVMSNAFGFGGVNATVIFKK